MHVCESLSGPYQAHLVLFDIASDGKQLRVVIEPRGGDRGREVADGLERLWSDLLGGHCVRTVDVDNAGLGSKNETINSARR